MPEETVSEVVVEETAPRTQNSRAQRVEDFLLDPEKVLFESIEELSEGIDFIRQSLAGVDLAALEQLQGADGVTPQIGVDYFTDEDLDAIQQFIEQNLPVAGVHFPTVEQVNTYIEEKVAEIPTQKGDKGERGAPGKDGRDGSRDTGKDILEKLRKLPKNQSLKIDDIRGLRGVLSSHAEQLGEVEAIKEIVENMRVIIPKLDNNGLQDINGLIEAGTNIVLTGSGTADDPYVISTNGITNVDWGDIGGTLSDQTDLQNALNAKFDEPTGTTSQYIRGDGSLATFPAIPQGTVTSVGMTVPTGLQVSGSPITSSGTLALTLASGYIIPTTTALAAKLENITGLVSAGTDISISGTGTPGDPYVVNATGGSGVPTLDQVLQSGDTAEDKQIVLESSTTSDTSTLDEFGLTINDGAGSQSYVGSTKFALRQSSNEASIVSIAIDANRTHTLQNKSGTLAHTDDITLGALGITASASELNILDGVTATTTELNYVDGVTSAIQTQLNAKAADSDVVKLTGNQTVAGIKTFSSFPVTPSSAPTTDYQVANKKYVDDNAGSTLTVEQSGETPVANVDHIVFDGATVTDDGSGQVTVEIEGAAGDTILDLTELTTPAGADNMVIVDDTDSTTKRITASTLSGFFADPLTNDGDSLGTGSLSWSDLFLATGGVINFGNGNYTLTHSTGVLTASNDFRISSVGTNANSVPTLGSTSTLTSKIVRTRNSVTTSASSLTPNFNTANYYEYTALAADFTLNLATNMAVGDVMTLVLTATGANRTFTANAGYDFADGNDAPANIETGYQYEFVIHKTTSHHLISWSRYAV